MHVPISDWIGAADGVVVLVVNGSVNELGQGFPYWGRYTKTSQVVLMKSV